MGNLYIWVSERIYHFKNEQRGSTVIEYALIASAIAITLVLILTADNNFISVLKTKYSEIFIAKK